MFIADLHIHSHYSRAVSSQMEVGSLALWSKRKGVNLLGTGDFTHHLWVQELKRELSPVPGTGYFMKDGVYFVLSGEVSNIFSQDNKTYRVHNLILAPSFELVRELNRMFSFYGNLASDGRPILKLSCRRMAEEIFKISSEIMLIPAHIWTPWYSLFGANSGFDSLDEAFGKYADKITAFETGLSSDPPMNWRLSCLDNFSLVSNSDAHSPNRIGREANVFSEFLNYWQLKDVLERKDKEKFLFTIEMFPQEGKYHYDGHRNCDLRLSPRQTKDYKGICPVCGKRLTVGVLNRIDTLADREDNVVLENAIGFKSLVPLDEIIADSKGVKRGAKKVEVIYKDIIDIFGSELDILLNISEDTLYSQMPDINIADGVLKVRRKELDILPGFDGEYGQIKIFGKKNKEENAQISLF